MTSQQRLVPVTFANRSGLRLFGIVHEPTATPANDVSVVLLSPGIKSRTAPHRLYNKMAEELVAQGFRVLRFDFNGLGDSDGLVDEVLLRDVYSGIQLGRFVDDSIAALDWMESTFGSKRIVIGGLCGGALTGLLAAEQDTRVAGILALGLPVMLDATAADSMRFMTAGQLNSIRSRYFGKAFDLGSWSRLLTFRSDYRLLFKALLSSFGGAKKAATPQSSAAGAQQPVQRESNTNPLVPPAFSAAVSRGCPMLLAFSEVDRLYWEFSEKFLEPNRQTFDRNAHLVEVRVLKSANHVLTFSEWQADMMASMRQWMERHFPTTAGRSPVEAAS